MADTIAALGVDITGDSRDVERALDRVQRELIAAEKQAEAAARSIEDALGRLDNTPKMPPLQLPDYKSGEQGALRYAQALARLEAAQGSTASAITVLDGALAGVDKNSLSAIRAQTQLAGLQNRLAKEAGGAKGALQDLAGAASGLGSALGAIGFGVGIEMLGQFAVSAAQQAQQLEKVQATVRAVSGDQATYARVLQTAEQNQRLLGGSLAENVSAMQQFLFISNRTGASLEELNKVAQLLSVINPTEGFQGAGVALSEMFSGDVTSIVERFNLPREAVRALAAEGVSAQERLAGLTALLAEQGVTSATLAASLDTTAASYDRLGVAVNNATVSLGTFISSAGRPAADAAALAAQGLGDFLARLNGAPGVIGQTNAALVAGAASYQQYTAGLSEANLTAASGMQSLVTANQGLITGLSAAIPGFGALVTSLTAANVQMQALTPAQFAYAQALIASGMAEQQAVAAAQGHATELANIQTVIDVAGGGLDAYSARLAAAAASSDGAMAAAQNLVNAYYYQVAAGTDASVATQNLETALLHLEASQRAESAASADAASAADEESVAHQGLAAAVDLTSEALIEEIAQKQASEAQSQRLAAAQAALAQLGSAVASGLLTAGQAAGQMAAQYGIAEAAALRLVQAQATLARVQATVKAGVAGVPEAYMNAATGGRTVAQVARDREQSAARATAAEKAYQEALRASERAARASGGGGGGGGGTRPTRAPRPAGGGGGGGASAATKAAQREAQQLQSAQDRADQQRADAATRLQERLLQIEENGQARQLQILETYAEKQRAALGELAVDAAGSRADFYDALTQSTLPPEAQQRLSAAYEQAFAEAQSMAQSGQAELASRYLALRQQQIDAERAYQEKLAAAREKGDQNEVARLEAIHQLRVRQQQAELDLLKQAGDQNVRARDEGLTEVAADQTRQQAAAQSDYAAKLGDVNLAEERKLDTLQRQTTELRTQQALTGSAAPATAPPTAAAAPAVRAQTQATDEVARAEAEAARRRAEAASVTARAQQASAQASGQGAAASAQQAAATGDVAAQQGAVLSLVEQTVAADARRLLLLQQQAAALGLQQQAITGSAAPAAPDAGPAERAARAQLLAAQASAGLAAGQQQATEATTAQATAAQGLTAEQTAQAQALGLQLTAQGRIRAESDVALLGEGQRLSLLLAQTAELERQAALAGGTPATVPPTPAAPPALPIAARAMPASGGPPAVVNAPTLQNTVADVGAATNQLLQQIAAGIGQVERRLGEVERTIGRTGRGPALVS